jgi:hypothetical protein
VIGILAALAKLPGPVVDLIGAIVRGIASSPDPYGRAKRIVEEEARQAAFDQAMRQALPKR